MGHTVITIEDVLDPCLSPKNYICNGNITEVIADIKNRCEDKFLENLIDKSYFYTILFKSTFFIKKPDLIGVIRMDSDIFFYLKSTPYDSNYAPTNGTRITTNYANLAKDPDTRQKNITSFLKLVNRDLNQILAGDLCVNRFEIQISILSIIGQIKQFENVIDELPFIEVMKAQVIDHNDRITFDGPIGLNYSSYIRDYDFKIIFPKLNINNIDEVKDFGRLHGILSKAFFGKDGIISDNLIIAISIAQNTKYIATEYTHPILGRKYNSLNQSITDKYFSQMGLQPYYFKPNGFSAPLAIYSFNHKFYNNNKYYLAALVAVMGNFQRIYRPEIYLSCKEFSGIPGEISQASLSNVDYKKPSIFYDKTERDNLSQDQAYEIEKKFFNKYPEIIHKLKMNIFSKVRQNFLLPDK